MIPEIKPEIKMTVRLSSDDLKTIIRGYLETQGYKMVGEVTFDIREECQGYGMAESYKKVLKGAVVQVEKIGG